MSQYHCEEAEREGGCECAQTYERGLDLMATDGTGYTVTFIVEPRDLILLATLPCERADLKCAFTVERDPRARRLFITHSPGYGFTWRLMTTPDDRSDGPPYWYEMIATLRPIVHETIDQLYARHRAKVTA